MSNKHEKNTSQQGTGKGGGSPNPVSPSQDQEEFARLCARQNIAPYNDVMKAWKNGDNESIQRWRKMAESSNATATQRETDPSGA
jgi:hypothetical protein